ncbi:MAG: ATP-binding protein [Thermoplasmata archaeon]
MDEYEFSLERDDDLYALYDQLFSILGEKGISRLDTTKVVTAASELARNIIQYVGKGKIKITIDENTVILTSEDNGKGIEHLDEILAGRYRSKHGLGKGLLAVKNLMDEMKIDTSPEGTKIRCVKYLG